MDATTRARNSIKIEPLKPLAELVPKPVLSVAEPWPPYQLTYLDFYLGKLGCKTMALESHYIDRDFISDHAALYSRCLRSYPNHCQRVHFFKNAFDADQWRFWIRKADADSIADLERELTAGYLGFVVLRPLGGSPVGRTVVSTYPNDASSGSKRVFDCVKRSDVHLGPFHLSVVGLPFQQQDSGVSACATAALWSSLHKISQFEGRSPPTPAEITQAASRYLLLSGRAFPSSGLRVEQMAEAIRSAGFEPVHIPATQYALDKAQLLAYIRSGFPPVVCVLPFAEPRIGHAVCAVGVRLTSSRLTKFEDSLYCDAASAMEALYVHDDRLGPYAAAELTAWTVTSDEKENQPRREGAPQDEEGAVSDLPKKKPDLATVLEIQWPDKIEWKRSRLVALIVPVPSKVRLSVTRMLEVGRVLAEVAGIHLAKIGKEPILGCRYATAVHYRRQALSFGISEPGNHALQCELLLSRYVGLVELTTREEPLLDILFDSTEPDPSQAMVAAVLRAHKLPESTVQDLRNLILTMNMTFVD